MLEHGIREELNQTSPRVMAVLRPLRMVIDNYPEGQLEELDAVNNPEDPSAGTRKIPFSRVVYIERADFHEDPPRKFFRLAPGREVRLRYAYIITCLDVVKAENGEIVEIHCTYDRETRSGGPAADRKVKATIHWVSAEQAMTAEVRLYDHFFTKPDPDNVEEGKEFTDYLNPNSLEVLTDCKLEPGLADAEPGARFQFERQGYFCVDTGDSAPGAPVFNRTVSLRDTWAKILKAQQQKKK
jgi:glutaminyl-tRNA synthetase